MRLLALALVVGSGLLQLVCAQQAFLQGQLPLKVLVTTPSELASDGAAQPVTLTGRQAITVSVLQPHQHLKLGASPWQAGNLSRSTAAVWAVEGPCSMLAASSPEPSAGLHAAHTSPSS